MASRTRILKKSERKSERKMSNVLSEKKLKIWAMSWAIVLKKSSELSWASLTISLSERRHHRRWCSHLFFSNKKQQQHIHKAYSLQQTTAMYNWDNQLWMYRNFFCHFLNSPNYISQMTRFTANWKHVLIRHITHSSHS